MGSKSKKAPKRRNIIHQHAKRRSGAGVHHDKRRKIKQKIGKEDMQISLSDFRAEHGITNGTDMVDALAEWSSDSVVPALCSEGCEVEPDGQCEHGCPSILVRMGVI
mgnify:CR=1 FL=1